MSAPSRLVSLALSALLLPLLLTAPAVAQPRAVDALGAPALPLPAPGSSTSPVRLELLGGSTAPLDASLHARVLFFDRVIVSASAGASVYGGVVQELVRGYGGEAAGELATNLGNGFFVGRLGLGFRPFGDLGLELGASYVLLHRAARLDGAVVAAVFGAPSSSMDVHAEVAIHALSAELAWSFVVLEHFVLRVGLGWTHALAADVRLRAEGEGAAQAQQAIDRAAAQTREAITTYGMTPTASLQLGYRF
jgi:hypothetical protein